MTALALTTDSAIALAISALALAWLLRRGWRTFAAKKGGSCGCGDASACGKGGPTVADLRRAAERAAERVNRGSTPVAR